MKLGLSTTAMEWIYYVGLGIIGAQLILLPFGKQLFNLSYKIGGYFAVSWIFAILLSYIIYCIATGKRLT
jgi:hypothetical protein